MVEKKNVINSEKKAKVMKKQEKSAKKTESEKSEKITKSAEIEKSAAKIEKLISKPASKPVQKSAVKREKKKVDLKLFGKWDSNVQVEPSLERYINLDSALVPKSSGIHKQRFHKSKSHIIERLILHMMVPGHTGKNHRMTSGKLSAKFYRNLKTVENVMNRIEEKEKKNPVEVIVRAVENAALREEVTSYQLGSITAREAVITSPQRRVDKALRFIAQGSFKKSFRKKTKIEDALFTELVNAYKNSTDSFAIKEKERIESEATGSR